MSLNEETKRNQIKLNEVKEFKIQSLTQLLKLSWVY